MASLFPALLLCAASVHPDTINDIARVESGFNPYAVAEIIPEREWICPYISRHLLSLNPLLACCRRYSRGER